MHITGYTWTRTHACTLSGSPLSVFIAQFINFAPYRIPRLSVYLAIIKAQSPLAVDIVGDFVLM